MELNEAINDIKDPNSRWDIESTNVILKAVADGTLTPEQTADEITRLRARLEQAERSRAHWRLTALMSRREGFRAGIEASAKLAKWHSDTLVERIRALAEQKESE